MNPKTRIVQFVENQGLTINAFSIKVGVSNSYFNNDSAIGSDKLLKIFSAFPQLNMDWVITGRGEMLNEEAKEKDWKAEYEALSLKHQAMMEKYVAAVEQKESKTTVALPVISNKT